MGTLRLVEHRDEHFLYSFLPFPPHSSLFWLGDIFVPLCPCCAKITGKPQKKVQTQRNPSFTSAKSRNNSDTCGFQATLCFGHVAYQGRHIDQMVPVGVLTSKKEPRKFLGRDWFRECTLKLKKNLQQPGLISGWIRTACRTIFSFPPAAKPSLKEPCKAQHALKIDAPCSPNPKPRLDF